MILVIVVERLEVLVATLKHGVIVIKHRITRLHYFVINDILVIVAIHSGAHSHIWIVHAHVGVCLHHHLGTTAAHHHLGVHIVIAHHHAVVTLEILVHLVATAWETHSCVIEVIVVLEVVLSILLASTSSHVQVVLERIG